MRFAGPVSAGMSQNPPGQVSGGVTQSSAGQFPAGGGVPHVSNQQMSYAGQVSAGMSHNLPGQVSAGDFQVTAGQCVAGGGVPQSSAGQFSACPPQTTSATYISIVGHSMHLDSSNLVCMLTKTFLMNCNIKNQTKPVFI